jgi:hypothetical protein
MAQWSSMPYFHSSMEQPGMVGALLWNGAAASFGDGGLAVEGYPTPRGALDASLHTRRLRERGEGVSQAPQNADIGRDVLPQNVGCQSFRISLACSQFASDDTGHIPDTATSRQAPTSIPVCRTSLLHPGGSVTQEWQPALKQ